MVLLYGLCLLVTCLTALNLDQNIVSTDAESSQKAYSKRRHKDLENPGNSIYWKTFLLHNLSITLSGYIQAAKSNREIM